MADESRLETLKAMLAEDPEDAFSRYAVAMELKGLGRRDEALAEFQTLVRTAADYVAGYHQCGRLLADLGRDEEAAAVVRQGIEVARAAGDDHALSELEDLLDEVE